jgi:hypothetical protein
MVRMLGGKLAEREASRRPREADFPEGTSVDDVDPMLDVVELDTLLSELSFIEEEVLCRGEGQKQSIGLAGGQQVDADLARAFLVVDAVFAPSADVADGDDGIQRSTDWFSVAIQSAGCAKADDADQSRRRRH